MAPHTKTKASTTKATKVHEETLETKAFVMRRDSLLAASLPISRKRREKMGHPLFAGAGAIASSFTG
jgi:hypothetical protein